MRNEHEVRRAQAVLEEIERKDKERRDAIEKSQRERIKQDILAGKYICCKCDWCQESYMNCEKPDRSRCIDTIPPRRDADPSEGAL